VTSQKDEKVLKFSRYCRFVLFLLIQLVALPISRQNHLNIVGKTLMIGKLVQEAEMVNKMNIEDIWFEYKDALKRFLHAKISNEADVEDLLQDILIKTYNNLNAVKKQKSVKSWLFQIANNTIIDYYRKKGRIQASNNEDFITHEETQERKVDLSNCISPFINALPDEHANLLIAIDLNNQSQKHYAEQLGISYSTLKSRVKKSRSLLKQVFDNCCTFDIDKLGNVYGYDRKTRKYNNCK